jgi:3-phenylpropionate/trans-cinnamate dioxygenase ferredoxin component
MIWTKACATDDLADGEARVVAGTDGAPIALFRVDGQYFAVEDTCPHGQYSLADGYIDNEIVECPLHFAKFDIRTGKVRCLPATRDLKSYAVQIRDDSVFVEVS